MSRQLEKESEDKSTKKTARVGYALDFGISDALQANGNTLKGIAITFQPGSSRIVVKAVVGGVHSVAFVYSNTVTNCILKVWSLASARQIQWGADNYHQQ